MIQDGFYISMKKPIRELLKIVRDTIITFSLCIVVGLLDGFRHVDKWWCIISAGFTVIFVFALAIGRMKIGKGERATYPLEDQMIDYYLKDKNFVTLTLKVCDVEFKDGKNQLFLTFEIEETIDIEYRLEGEKTFVLVYQDRYNLDINNGDVLTFTTAPQKYYNRHTLPILSLHKDNEEIVSIKEGTNNYISWISNNIK